MGFRPKSRQWHRALTGATGCLCLGHALIGLAGEPIRFSDVETRSTPGSTRPTAPPPRDSFDFLDRKSSLSVVVPPTLSSGPNLSSIVLRNQKSIQEYMDRKDWIFRSTPELGGTNSVADLLGVKQDADTPLGDARVKSGVERYVEKTELGGRGRSAEDASKAASRNADTENESKTASRGTDTDEKGRSPSAPGEDDARPKSDPVFDLSAAGNRAGMAAKAIEGLPPMPLAFTPRDFGNPDNPFRNLRSPEQEKERAARLETVRRALDLPSSLSPVVGSIDPINLPADLSRQALNPVVAGGTDGFLPVVAVSTDVFPSAAGPANRGVASVLDGLQSRTPAASSLAPILAAPPDRPLFKPKAGNFEVPKRMF